MSGPAITASMGAYLFVWPEPGRIAVKVDRLKEDSRALTARVKVSDLRSDAQYSHMHQARLNLESTSARNGLVKQLKERVDVDYIDWYGIVEKVCYEVQRLHDLGEPTVQLATHEVSERVQDILTPILPDRSPTLIHAHGGTGKTLIAHYFSTLVASGMRHCALTPEPGSVLLIDYETDADESRDRVAAIARGLDIPVPENIWYRYAHQPLASDIEEIQRQVSDKGITFIVIDSAAMACGGEPEKIDTTMRYFTALRSLRIASLTIAHVSKGQPEAAYGSQAWHNAPRRTYRLTSTQQPGDASFVLGLTNTKTNWANRLAPIGLRVTFDGPAVRFEQADVKDVPELDQQRSTRERIKDLLSHGAMIVQEIAVELDVGESQVRARLTEGRGKHFVELVAGEKPHKWGVLSNDA